MHPGLKTKITLTKGSSASNFSDSLNNLMVTANTEAYINTDNQVEIKFKYASYGRSSFLKFD